MRKQIREPFNYLQISNTNKIRTNVTQGKVLIVEGWRGSSL